MTRMPALLLALATCSVFAQSPPADLALQTVVASGFDQPLAVRYAPDGSGRVFVVQKGGSIGVVAPGASTFTEFFSLAVAADGERGLLGLAFHPDYDGADERRFYVSYTSATAGNPQAIAEFRTTAGNPNTVDVASRREVIRVPDLASNHNGGDIAFGPDGFLYWSMGDGGPQGDPNGFAQCLWKKPQDGNPANCSPAGGTNYFLLGKIMRIDPTQTTASATAEMCAATAGQPAGYRIPANNPFVGSSNTCDEIAYYGMRNPWRISFDRDTGDLYVADVGQNQWEETTRIPAGDLGNNLGWRCYEGTVPYNAAGSCTPTPANITFPFQTYQHLDGRCSISGGYRYRGPITGLVGTYISADYCSGEIFFAQRDEGTGTWTPGIGAVDVWKDNAFPIAGFGEDEVGNLYVANYNGALLRFYSAGQLFADGFED